MTIACAALLGSVLFAAPARVGVVVVGDDPGAAGDLQRTIELRLSANKRLELVGAAELGAALPAAPPRPAGTRPIDPMLQKEAAGLLQEATDAYYQDRAAVALDRLGALQALQERTQAFPTTERVRILLWRTAVFLALKDDTQAETEALAALTLMPDVKVDLNEFRPSVKDAVERVRARGFRTVTVVVSGRPAGGTLELDDRAVAAPFKASAGKHRLTARAPGRRDVVRTFDASSDISLSMVLPFAMDPATEAAFAALAANTDPTKEQRQAAEQVASRLKLDWIVVASAGTDARAIALSSKTHQSAPPSSPANVAAWIDERLSGGSVAVATPRTVATPMPTPRAVATSRPVRPPGSTALALAAGGGIAWTTRSRSLEGKDGGGFDTSFAGVGPRVTVDASYGSPFAHVAAAWINYGISTLDVTLPDGTSKSVTGGTTTIARLHAGWRQSFGSRGEPDAAPSVYGAIGGSFETHAADDVKDPASGELGLLTGYSRTAIEIALGGRYPIGGSLRPAISAGLIVAPTSTWSETPANTSGKKPAPAVSFGWNLGIAATPMSSLTVALEYSGSMRSVGFSGEAEAPVDPALTDPTIKESFHSVSVTAGYRF